MDFDRVLLGEYMAVGSDSKDDESLGAEGSILSKVDVWVAVVLDAVVVVKVKMGFWCVEEGSLSEGSVWIVNRAVLPWDGWDGWDEGSALCSLCSLCSEDGGDTRTDPVEPGTKRPLDRFPSNPSPRPVSTVPNRLLLLRLLWLLLACVSCMASVMDVGEGKSGESSGRPTIKK